MIDQALIPYNVRYATLAIDTWERYHVPVVHYFFFFFFYQADGYKKKLPHFHVSDTCRASI